MTLSALPLHQIQAFDAAARHLSFSRAATELNVLGPAIGRQVAQLEADLGIVLFRRTKPRLTLTEEGELLARSVTAGFSEIRDGLALLRKRSGTTPIVVNAAIGFTSFYLLPRMAEFQSLHPDIDVQVVTRDQDPDYDPTACDVVVTFGEQGLPRIRSAQVIPERLVAVCSTSYLQEAAPLSLEALSRERLLYMSGSNHFDDWKRFFAGSGFRPPQPPQHVRIHSFMVYIRAIQNGMGIGLGWRPFVDDFINTGSLMIACDHECHTARGYHCSLTARGASRAGAARFLEWLCQ